MSALPMTPRSLADPPETAIATPIVQRWDIFLGHLASGLSLADAMRGCYIRRADIETMTRLNDGGVQLQRWNDARLAGLKKGWSVFDFEDIFERVASGMRIRDAVAAVKPGFEVSKMYRMINQDPEIAAMYKQAQEQCMLQHKDEIIEIVDDTSEDVLDNGKGGQQGNMAAVGRAKLRTDQRFRMMGILHSKIFAEKKDQVNVQVNVNHAQTLEDARERASQRDKPKITKQQMEKAIDATFKQVPPEEDTSWMDDKPTDTTWREES